jgi:tetratricopeptide (TPR) repeat protein
MELGKKLKMVEHLISSNPRLVGDGQTINIDLRSSSPWAMQHTYIEFKSTYGIEDKRGVDVRLDAGGARFTIDGKEAPMRELQSTLEQRHLVHMIEDAQRVYDGIGNVDAQWVKDVLASMKKAADGQKPLDPNLREAWRMLPRAGGLREKASALYDLLVRIDGSVERWFVPYSGLVASEVDARLAQAIEAEKRGDVEAARRDLEDIVDLAPEHGGAQHALGALLVTHYPETRLAQAQRALEKAVQVAPTKAAAHAHLGDVCFCKGDIPAAKHAYQHAVELGREALAASLFGLGQCAELEQDWQAAKGYYVRAARAEDDHTARRIIDLSAIRVDRKAQKK